MKNLKHLNYILLVLFFSPFIARAQNGCNVTWTTSNSSITINGLDSPHTIMKLFTPDWNIHTECFDDCQSPTTISGLSQGIYHLSYDLYDANWQKICNDLVDVNVSGGGNSDQPDLTVSNLSINGSGKSGDIISYSFDLNNIGNAVAQGDYQIKVYLSTDNQWSSDDALAGYVDTGNTPIGTIANVNASITVPNLESGNYFLILKADDGNVIDESNESNNTTFIAFSVVDDGGMNTSNCGFKNENIWSQIFQHCTSQETANSFIFSCENQDEAFDMTIDKNGVLQSVEQKNKPTKNHLSISMNTANMIVIKYLTEDNTELWTRTVSLPLASKYTSRNFVAGSGLEVYDGFLIAGTIAANENNGNTDFLQYSIKLNADANVVNRNVLGKDVIGDFIFHLDNVFSTRNGYVCAMYQSNLRSFVKFSESGLLLWKTPFASDLPSNTTREIEISSDEQYIYAANTDNLQPKVIKVNTTTGAEVYKVGLTSLTNAATNGYILGIASSANGYILASYRGDNFSTSAPLIYIQIDANGNKIWEKQMSTAFNFFPTQQTSDGGYLFIASKNEQIAVMKTTENGELTPDCGNSGNENLTDIISGASLQDNDPIHKFFIWQMAVVNKRVNTAFQNKIYLSTDQNLSGDDYLLSTYDIPGARIDNWADSYPIVTTNEPFASLPNGDYYLIFSVDSNNDIAESDENNNISRVPFHLNRESSENSLACDLQYATTSTSLSIFGDGMNEDHISVQIFDPNWTTVYSCSDNCGNSIDLSNLDANQTYHVKVTTYSTNASGGWELICDKLTDVTLGGGNGGGNNSDKADLTITNLQTTNGQAGDVVSYSFDLNNIGTSDATGDYVINAYLSTDNQWSTNDAFAGAVNTGNTPIGTISNVNATITIPNLDAGNYYLILKADVNNDIDESNENNNVVANSITILSNTSNSTCGFRNENFVKSGNLGKISATENSNGFRLSARLFDEYTDSVYVLNIDHNGDFVSNNTTVATPNNQRVKTSVNRSTGELKITYLVNDVNQWETTTILDPGSGLTFADAPNYSAVKVSDGVLVAGTVVGLDATGTDYLKQFTIKLNQNGVITNSHVFDEGTISGDYYFFIRKLGGIESTDMGYLVQISTPQEIFLGKFSQTGEFLWKTQLAADLPSNFTRQFIQSKDKQFIYYSNINNGNAGIKKINASTGELEYSKHVGEILDLGVTYGSPIIGFSGVLPTQDGGLVTFFSSGDIGGETPIKVYGKIDASGNKVWQHVIETESSYLPILETEDGSFLFVGRKRVLQIPNIHWSLSVMKVTSDGNLTPDCGGGNGGGNGNQTSIACDVNYTISGSNLSFSGNADHISIQIFNHNWSQTVYSCSDNCDEGFDLGNLDITEQYHVKVTTYNTNANGGWEQTCEKLMDVVFNASSNIGFVISETKDIQSTDYGVLYPNPATNIVYLKLNDFVGKPVNISIVNSLGQMVKQQVSEAGDIPIQMDVTDLQSGIYQVLIDVENEDVFVKKLMIEK